MMTKTPIDDQTSSCQSCRPFPSDESDTDSDFSYVPDELLVDVPDPNLFDVGIPDLLPPTQPISHRTRNRIRPPPVPNSPNVLTVGVPSRPGRVEPPAPSALLKNDTSSSLNVSNILYMKPAKRYLSNLRKANSTTLNQSGTSSEQYSSKDNVKLTLGSYKTPPTAQYPLTPPETPTSPSLHRNQMFNDDIERKVRRYLSNTVPPNTVKKNISALNSFRQFAVTDPTVDTDWETMELSRMPNALIRFVAAKGSHYNRKTFHGILSGKINLN